MHGIPDINWLYFKYYRDNPELRRIVIVHSEQVAKKALNICKIKNLNLDPKDVFCAGLLHDIGVVKCNAPDIHAHGNLHYLQHGIEGMKILESNGLQKYASVCLTHIGAGISIKDIETNHLPLPSHDMIPFSLLEKLICYADKFFSKNHDLKEEKSLEKVILQIEKYGPDSIARFLDMHRLFELNV